MAQNIKQFKQNLIEKIPFFTIAFTASVVAIVTQFQSGAGWGLAQNPLSFRLLNACHSLIFYLSKAVLPTKLAAFYPLLTENTFSPGYIFSVFVILLFTWICWKYRKKAFWLTAAWIYYIITLTPALGLIQVGNQAAADRFTYLPLLSLFLVLSVFFVQASRVWRPFLLIFAITGVGLLGFETCRQVLVWRDSISLWENVLNFYPNNNLTVHQNLGRAYEDAGRLPEALAKYDDAIHPSFHFLYPHWGKGRVLTRLRRWDEAILEYKTALAMDPSFPPLYDGLGLVYWKMGSTSLALPELQRAIQLDPHYADAYEDLGLIYQDQNLLDEAVKNFQVAYSLDPDNPSYFKKLISAYRRTGQNRKALVLYRELSDRAKSLVAINY